MRSILDMPDVRLNILEAIGDEREQQIKTWGEQAHKQNTWNSILGEEVGEVAKAVVENHFDGTNALVEDIEHELIQVAAVCVAWVESIRTRRIEDSTDD